VPLHVSQSAAIEHFASYARTRRAGAQRTIADILAMSNLEPDAFQRGMQNLRQHARVVLHFHPDRLNAKLQTVAESLLECGVYQGQFQTLISNGSVSAYPGGERDQWEQRLFGGAYHRPDTTAAHRPKYGALDVLRHSDGPSPAFGSCYFVLAQPVSERATFTYLDSHTEPPERGTLDELDDIVAAMFKDSFMRDFTLGQANLRPGRLLEQLLTRLPQPYEDASTRPPSRNLGHYIEAQVHGEVSLREDVETLVIDPSFRSSALAQTLEALCDRASLAPRLQVVRSRSAERLSRSHHAFTRGACCSRRHARRSSHRSGGAAIEAQPRRLGRQGSRRARFARAKAIVASGGAIRSAQ
jgi:hypothetical protein